MRGKAEALQRPWLRENGSHTLARNFSRSGADQRPRTNETVVARISSASQAWPPRSELTPSLPEIATVRADMAAFRMSANGGRSIDTREPRLQ